MRCAKNFARIFRKDFKRMNITSLYRTNGAGDKMWPVNIKFPDSSDDKRFNAGAMKGIESFMRLRLTLGWEKQRSNEICFSQLKNSETFVQESARLPKTYVISQTANHYAVRMLAEQRTYEIQEMALRKMREAKKEVPNNVNSQIKRLTRLPRVHEKLVRDSDKRMG